MPTIGIIAAMDSEINLIKSKMEVVMTKSAVGAEVYIGSMEGKSVALVKCGVGKVNAAVRTQALIDLFAVDYIINTGVAGAIYRDAKIGDIVISSSTVQHDFDCAALGFKKGEIPWDDRSVCEADSELIEAANNAAKELGFPDERNVYTAKIASGDIFVTSKEVKKEIWESFSAYCVEMEGAAIAHACSLNKIPFVIIRSISDNADTDGTGDFNAFALKAAEISQKITVKIIERL